ncbi:VOC family protein [Nocardia sp. CA-128927]|uniref:VOC family protein n=1 Tax=Nocardia sp. CA-128927 TaxID=3239975 RepID=UPI003D95766E
MRFLAHDGIFLHFASELSTQRSIGGHASDVRDIDGTGAWTMIRGIHHVAVATRDMDRLLPFYRDLLGCEVLFDIEIPSGTDRFDNMTALPDAAARCVMLRAGNAYIEMFQYRSPHPPAGNPSRPFNEPGYSHFCFDVTDIDAEYARLSQAGMVFHAPPQAAEDGKATYGRDPDGNVIELQELFGNGLGIALPWLPPQAQS